MILDWLGQEANRPDVAELADPVDPSFNADRLCEPLGDRVRPVVPSVGIDGEPGWGSIKRMMPFPEASTDARFS
jgi:hypothetical protein